MARTNTTNAVETNNADMDQELMNILLNGVQSQQGGRTITEWVEDTATNVAKDMFKTSAKIGGALMAAGANAKQAFHMERNFRAAEMQVQAQRDAARYLARLKALQQ